MTTMTGASERHHAIASTSSSSRKPKRMFRYLEGFLSEQERLEHEQLQLQAAAATNDDSASTADASSSNGGKRIKTAKACLFCKRSHMSCEIERPCSRCISRGIGERCCDTEEELAELVSAARTGTGRREMSASTEESIGGIVEPMLGDVDVTQDASTDIGDPSFEDILTFLGNMQAATEEWGPVPSASTISPRAFEQPTWAAAMTPSNDQAQESQQASTAAAAAALHFLADNAISPPRSTSNHAQASDVLGQQTTGVEQIRTIEDANKPFVSGSLPFYAEEKASTQAPWCDILRSNWTSSASLEDSLTRPYQYAYGYTRIERWIKSPLSGWTADSAAKVKAVLDRTRPQLRQRWAVLSDLQLVQHEERHEAMVKHYRQHVCEAVPLPLIVVRRTFEIVCANRAFAKLCDTQQSVFDSGRLCLYQLLEQSLVVDVFQNMVKLIEGGKDAEQEEIRLHGRVKFTCSSSSSSEQSTVALRHVDRAVSLSLKAVIDEHGLPLCFVCALTPMSDELLNV